MNDTDTHVQFALCLDNTDYEASIELGKLYRVVAKKAAWAHEYVRVIDECGEDYAFSMERFHLLTLPEPVERTLLLALA